MTNNSLTQTPDGYAKQEIIVHQYFEKQIDEGEQRLNETTNYKSRLIEALFDGSVKELICPSQDLSIKLV